VKYKILGKFLSKPIKKLPVKVESQKDKITENTVENS
jgi:hypothetical protein